MFDSLKFDTDQLAQENIQLKITLDKLTQSESSRSDLLLRKLPDRVLKLSRITDEPIKSLKELDEEEAIDPIIIDLILEDKYTDTNGLLFQLHKSVETEKNFNENKGIQTEKKEKKKNSLIDQEAQTILESIEKIEKECQTETEKITTISKIVESNFEIDHLENLDLEINNSIQLIDEEHKNESFIDKQKLNTNTLVEEKSLNTINNSPYLEIKSLKSIEKPQRKNNTVKINTNKNTEIFTRKNIKELTENPNKMEGSRLRLDPPPYSKINKNNLNKNGSESSSKLKNNNSMITSSKYLPKKNEMTNKEIKIFEENKQEIENLSEIKNQLNKLKDELSDEKILKIELETELDQLREEILKKESEISELLGKMNILESNLLLKEQDNEDLRKKNLKVKERLGSQIIINKRMSQSVSQLGEYLVNKSIKAIEEPPKEENSTLLSVIIEPKISKFSGDSPNEPKISKFAGDALFSPKPSELKSRKKSSIISPGNPNKEYEIIQSIIKNSKNQLEYDDNSSNSSNFDSKNEINPTYLNRFSAALKEKDKDNKDKEKERIKSSVSNPPSK